MKLIFYYSEKIIEIIIVALFSVMIIATFMQVVSRYLFGISILGTDEISRYSMVWLTFLGAALAIRGKEHIKIDFFIRKLPQTLYHWVNVFINVVLIILISGLIYVNIPILESALLQTTIELNIPFGYVNLAIPVSGAFMIIYLVVDSLSYLKQKEDSVL